MAKMADLELYIGSQSHRDLPRLSVDWADATHPQHLA
jgi:hypothetical protein